MYIKDTEWGLAKINIFWQSQLGYKIPWYLWNSGYFSAYQQISPFGMQIALQL